ncbi:MAG: aminoacetone oxidase family FAD-binding enzyme [Firmicutes bacterium]|nr:aminoacetone oxidase family FAD-binding enzyme [Bacillota bacterium]
MQTYDVAVIGGGASGIMAAVCAKQLNKSLSILVLEKSGRILKKLSVTGNGQGNFSNADLSLKHYFDNNFCKYALQAFDEKTTVEFFKTLGIESVNLNGRIYPMSLQASSLSDTLRFKCQDLNIEIKLDYNVEALEKKDNVFFINNEICAKKVIFACGGSASPKFNTDGSAYKLLTNLGHTLIKPLPSLVQIKTDNTYTKMLKGIKTNAKVSIKDTGYSFSEELLFCDYGLSGKVIFEISPFISRLLNKNNEIYLNVDLFYDLTYEQLSKVLLMRKNALSYLLCENFFSGLINKQIGKIIFKTANINLNQNVDKLTDKDIFKLAEVLKNFNFKALDTMGFDNAQTTIGGLSVLEFDDKTLMSKKATNLFACGEVLDVDGMCGGYNLQWAWSSGYLAGTCAASN